MAIPRPLLLALLGVALCGAAFVATRGASDTGGAVNQAPVTAPSPAVHHGTGRTPGHKAVHRGHHKAAPSHATKPKTPAKTAPAKPHATRAAKPAPAAPAKPSPSAVATTKVLTVLNAVNRGDVVVFYVDKPGAADDSATAQSVASLHGIKGVTVVPVGLSELGLYRSVLSPAGVTQLPAVLVTRKGHPARLIQGFVDANTLRQTVVDALR
jgi:hypothetical protein